MRFDILLQNPSSDFTINLSNPDQTMYIVWIVGDEPQ
jgi:hypothetical protein